MCKIFRLDEIIREIREPQRERYGSPQRMVSIPADSDTRLSLSPRLSQKVCDIFVIVCVCLCNILITILCVSCVCLVCKIFRLDEITYYKANIETHYAFPPELYARLPPPPSENHCFR